MLITLRSIAVTKRRLWPICMYVCMVVSFEKVLFGKEKVLFPL